MSSIMNLDKLLNLAIRLYNIEEYAKALDVADHLLSEEVIDERIMMVACFACLFMDEAEESLLRAQEYVKTFPSSLPLSDCIYLSCKALGRNNEEINEVERFSSVSRKDLYDELMTRAIATSPLYSNPSEEWQRIKEALYKGDNSLFEELKVQVLSKLGLWRQDN